MQIKYDTFVSSILLRQGEADKFILAKSTPRREIFLELLQLEFYRNLSKAAAERQRIAREIQKNSEKTLEGLEKPSAAAILDLQKEIERAEKELKKLSNEKSEKEREKQNAERAESIEREIAEIEARQKLDAELIERAAQTRQKYARYCELKEVVRGFENVRRERNDVADIEAEQRENNLKIARLGDALAEKEKEIEARSENREEAQKKHEELEAALRDLEAKQDELERKFEQIKEIEKGENRIEQEQSELEKNKSELSEAQQNVEALKRETKAKSFERDELAEKFNEWKSDLKIASELLENRRQVIDKDQCPLCGSELKNDEIHKQIISDFEAAEAAVEKLESQRQDLKGNLEAIKTKLAASEKLFEAENEKLQKFSQNETAINTRIETWRNQLDELPKFSSVQRTEIRYDFAKLQDEISNLKTQTAAAKDSFESLREKVGNLVSEKIRLESGLRNAEQNRTNLQSRKQKAEAKLAEATNQIASGWENHAALRDEDELNNLRDQKSELQSSEKEIEKLKDAETNKTVFENRFDLRQKDLAEIPHNHRRNAAQVKTELEEIEHNIELKKNKVAELDRNLRKTQYDKDEYDRKNAELENLKKDYRLWSALAKTFGKQGLETKIVREAQHKISENANRTLQALSNGNFQLELEGAEKMEIFVRDFATGERRAVEYFSGGEKFLTAVSLAVAIGQSASGQNIANTLIIDEGFGALDENKRNLMVEELNRLSNEVLENGRVIVVSHQNDVQENFSHRYLLTKKDNGLIQVHYGK